MIIRIMGEGQFEVPDDLVDELNRLDEAVVDAIDKDDEPSFRTGLDALLVTVRNEASPLPADRLAPSDLVLPPPDATLEEVRAILGEEGLIPG